MRPSESWRSSVVLPTPLRPTRPYLTPRREGGRCCRSPALDAVAAVLGAVVEGEHRAVEQLLLAGAHADVACECTRGPVFTLLGSHAFSRRQPRRGPHRTPTTQRVPKG